MKYTYYDYFVKINKFRIMNLYICERHVDQDFRRNALLVERMNKQKERVGEEESGRENRRIKYPPYFHGTLP